ncbi:centromere protein T isoform X2 [Excalfactoria chinensis]|uniref:centromere protein T isoform X2 n=1 Tax=Excalfactoria chinensis TaxID=46218 RepID=UPI003B3A9BF4
MVRRAAFHGALLTHRQPAGAGPGSGGPELHLHRQVDGLHVLGRAPYRGLGGGAGALRGRGGGGGGGSSGGGAGAAGGPRCFALVDAAQREDGGDPHQVGLAAALEVLAADPVPGGGLEGAEAAADARPGDVLQPEAPQLLVLGEGVEVQRLVAVRVVVAARHAAGEARHGGGPSGRGRGAPPPDYSSHKANRGLSPLADAARPGRTGTTRPTMQRGEREAERRLSAAPELRAPHCAASQNYRSRRAARRRRLPSGAARSRETAVRARLSTRRLSRGFAMAGRAGLRAGRGASRTPSGAVRASPRHHRARAGSGSRKENKAGSTQPRFRPNAFSELDNATPRLMLRRIIQNQPQVSPLALQTVQLNEQEDVRPEPPSQRTSSTVELQLPDLAPEDKSVTTFHMTRKRKKLSISEFERAADKRLTQNQAHSMLDSTLARSFRMSVGSVMAPDTVEKRGLLRRPQNRRAIDIAAFEGGVEQNMLQIKAQDYLVDLQASSLIGTTTIRTDTEVVLSNTELFVEPQFEQNHLAVEPQLSDSKTSAQRSNTSAHREASMEDLVSGASADEGKARRFSEKDLITDREHVDGMTKKTPAKQGEEEQDHSQQNDPMEQFSESEEMAGTTEHHADAEYSERSEKKLSRKAESQLTATQDVGIEMEMTPLEGGGVAEGAEHQDLSKAELEMAGSVGAGSLGRDSPASYSPEKSGTKPLKEAVEQTGEIERGTITGELDAAEVFTEDESEIEDNENEEISMKTPTFVRAAADRPHPVLPSPRPVKSAAPELPPQPVRAKPVPKSSGPTERKTREPEIARGLIKQIFSHYVKMPVARDAYKIVEKCSERYFKQISSDLEAYSQHAGRKTVEMADVELLMRRQGLVTDKMPLHVLVERHLPLEYRKLLIPIARKSFCQNHPVWRQATACEQLMSAGMDGSILC